MLLFGIGIINMKFTNFGLNLLKISVTSKTLHYSVVFTGLKNRRMAFSKT